MSIATIHYRNIVWDGEEGVALPTSMTITTDSSVLDDEDAENIISDMLTEATGLCHNSFNYEVQ